MYNICNITPHINLCSFIILPPKTEQILHSLIIYNQQNENMFDATVYFLQRFFPPIINRSRGAIKGYSFYYIIEKAALEELSIKRYTDYQ